MIEHTETAGGALQGEAGFGAPSLAKEVEAAIAGGTVELPVLPEIALGVRDVIAREGPLGEVVRVVEREPAFAAAVLRYANSVAFAGLRPVTDLKQAVSRLGMGAVEQTVLAVAARGAFQGSSCEDVEAFRVLWEHSLVTALAARRLAVRFAPPEQAFLAGLLHDIGKAVLLRCLATLRARDERFRLSPDALQEFMASLHCRAGDGFLETWNIPAEIRTAVRRHHDTDLDAARDGLVAVVACADRVAAKLGASSVPDPDASVLDHPAARVLRLDDVKIAALLVDVEDDVARVRGDFPH